MDAGRGELRISDHDFVKRSATSLFLNMPSACEADSVADFWAASKQRHKHPQGRLELRAREAPMFLIQVRGVSRMDNENIVKSSRTQTIENKIMK
jgi:hypothetical protein